MPRALLAVLAACLVAAPALPVEGNYPQATLRGFPDLSDEHGKKIADGQLTQWVEKGKLRVRLIWEFPSGRRIEEQAVLRQKPELAQESWSFEDRDGPARRRFDVDFILGRAAGSKVSAAGKREGWSKKIDVKAGKSFAGIAFGMAAAALYDRLKAGEKIDLDAVVFMPKPRTNGVTLSLEGAKPLRRGGKSLTADVITAHPKVPWPINKLLKVHDIKLWFFHGAPPQLLRAEMPLCEVNDPMVRIDVLPGGVKLPKAAARRR